MKRDCTCPRARHVHGTVGAYNMDGCRCFPCRQTRSLATIAYNNGESWAGEYFVDATGTRRRLQALAAIGVTYRTVAAYLGNGCHQTTIGKIAMDKGPRRVTLTTAQRIADAYDALWDKPGTDQCAAQARTRARRKGWPVPLAWDDDTIDDPDATPHMPTTNGTWDRKPCGTEAAYRRHLRNKEPIDEACRNANIRAVAQRKGAA